MIYIEILTNTDNVTVNEIWFKPANDLDKIDFLCIKRMEKNINYSVKYTNGAFYLLLNRSDTYDKSLKRIRINNPKIYGLLEHSVIHKKHKNETYTEFDTSKLNPLAKSKNSELQIIDEKNKIIDVFEESLSQSTNSIIALNHDIVGLNENINIINFEVFKNYLVILEEAEKTRRFKIYNLKTNNFYIHEPPVDNMNIVLQDNVAFESNYFRYLTSGPVMPVHTVDFSMGTRKPYTVHTAQYLKHEPNKYKSEVIYIPDRDNEVKIPVIISYKEDLYNNESPFILYTKGALSNKTDLNFKETLVSLMDKGFVWAVPQIRGTNFFDFDWYSQAIAEHKIKHFTDFIDVAYHLKDNSLCGKIIIYGEGYSGGLTAAVAFMQNPNFFDATVLHNAALDVFELCMDKGKDIKIIEEFGDIIHRQYYELMKLYSPHHTLTPVSHTPILVACDPYDKNMSQSMKFVAKLRYKNKDTGDLNKIYFEVMTSRINEIERQAYISSFILGNTYLI